MTPLLHLKNVSVAAGAQVLVHNITMSIHRGQKYLIIGAFGSGKSTLLRALIGFAEIANGRYFYQNLPVTPACIIDFCSATGFVPQELDVGRGSVDA